MTTRIADLFATHAVWVPFFRSRLPEIVAMRRSFDRPWFRRRGLLVARCAVLAALVLLAAGCKGSTPSGPQLSQRDAANGALAEYDADKDGTLDARELNRCPALKGAVTRIDKNGDGRLNADEIANRVAFLRNGSPADISVEVLLDRRPLTGATVTLEPEPFMGPAFKPFSTATDRHGTGMLKPAEGGDDSLPLGYYRIKVSKKVKGQETIPPRYNSQTVLGQEIAPDAEGRGNFTTLRLALTSK